MNGIPDLGARIGPWRVVGTLGRGGMAIVLEVEHETTGDRRALKLMLPAGRSEEVARRFRREFRALSRLDHPNVLKVFEGGIFEGRPYFVMELLRGRDLREELEVWRALPPAERCRRARQMLIQLARALEYIHARGLVHRDVTPTNIMVLPDGTARLMDFGVVKEPGAELTRLGEVVGTVAYIAPEQIQGGEIDARADLYSLGAVLYLMLTGRRPFNARTLAGYLDKHLHREVRPPRELAPTIPAELDEICVRLLAKEPDGRFVSATHLLHALDVESSETHPGEWNPSLLGRAGEVARVREALARLGDGEGSVLWIEGQPGMGRTRMADQTTVLAQRMGLLVTRSRNTSPDQPPFEGFRRLFEALIAETGIRVPDALASTFGLTSARVRTERWSMLAAFRDLLLQGRPRVVLVEEMHRADRGTIEMAEFLVRNLLQVQPIPVLFAFTRTTPGPADGALEGLVTGQTTGAVPIRVPLGPLPGSGVEEMLLSLVHDSPAVRSLAERLHQEGEGNPYFVTEMLRELVTQGILQPGSGGARGELALDPAEVSSLALPVPSTMREAIVAQLKPLDRTVRAVAEILAVARREVSIELLTDASELDEEVVLTALDALLEAELIRERRMGTTEHFELAKNRLGDVLLEEIPEARRAVIHRRIGAWLERQYRRNPTAVVEALAWHFEQGGLPVKAVGYLVEAAGRLMDRAFVHEALAHLARARALEPAARDQLPLREADARLVDLGLLEARAHLHLGDWAEAFRHAQEADQLARELGDDRLLARTATELGEQARRVRRLEEAERELVRALRHGGLTNDPALLIVPLYELGAMWWSKGDLEAARGFFQRAVAQSELAGDDRHLAHGTNGLGLLAFCKGQSAEARRFFRQSIEVSERHGLEERLLIARTNLVELHHVTGNMQKGLELADLAVGHARDTEHRYGLGLALRYRSLILVDIGRLADAVESAEQSVRIQQNLGNHEEELAALVMLIRARMAAGQTVQALRLIEPALDLLVEFDSEGYSAVVRTWHASLLARTGRPDEARLALDEVGAPDERAWPHQVVRLQLDLAHVHAELGDPAAALTLAEAALQRADAAGFRYYAMRARLEAGRVAQDPEERARHLRVGEALARSLAAGLPRDEVSLFLARQGVADRLASRALDEEDTP